VYTPDAGHQHGDAQGPGGPPGRQSTPEVREYIVYTLDAGHQHEEAQGPRGPPGRQRTPEVREYTCTLRIQDTYMEKLRAPEGLHVSIRFTFPKFITQYKWIFGKVGPGSRIRMHKM
jgi:hypothetical protein